MGLLTFLDHHQEYLPLWEDTGRILLVVLAANAELQRGLQGQTFGVGVKEKPRAVCGLLRPWFGCSHELWAQLRDEEALASRFKALGSVPSTNKHKAIIKCRQPSAYIHGGTLLCLQALEVARALLPMHTVEPITRACLPNYKYAIQETKERKNVLIHSTWLLTARSNLPSVFHEHSWPEARAHLSTLACSKMCPCDLG